MTKKQAMPYMKLYTSYLDDIRLNRLPESTRWRYVQLYLLAWKSDSEGSLLDTETDSALTVPDIAMLLRADESAVIVDINQLTQAGLLEIVDDTLTVTRYIDEQINQAEFRREAAERQAKKRGKNVTRDSQTSVGHSKEKLSQEKLSQVTEKERDNLSVSQSSTSMDGLTDKNYPSSAESQEQERSKKPNPQSVYSVNESVNEVMNYFEKSTLERASHPLMVALEKVFDTGAKFGIGDAALMVGINERVEKTALKSDIHSTPTNYFMQCLREYSASLDFLPVANRGTIFAVLSGVEVQDGKFYLQDLNDKLNLRGFRSMTSEDLDNLRKETEAEAEL
jgi:hypothetical protein